MHGDLLRYLTLILITIFVGGCGLGDDDDSNARPCTKLGADDVESGALLDEDCYTISGALRVESGDLRIEPGTTLYFDRHAGFAIAGDARLVAHATDDEVIELRGDKEEFGFWRGIRLESTGPHELEGLRIADAGSRLWDSDRRQSRGGIVLSGDTTELEIVDSTLENHEYAAISSDSSLATVRVSGTDFSDSDYPLSLNGNQLGELTADNIISGNRYDVVRIHSEEPVTRDATWIPLSVPYQFAAAVPVESSITIAPDTTMLFGRDAGLDVDGGTLHVDAQGEEAVRFLGAIDTRGHWIGLRMANTPSSSKNMLRNVELRHGGGLRWEHMWSNSQALILVDTDGQLQISDATITDSDYHGISARESLIEGCENITWGNNYRHDTFILDDADTCFE